MAKAFAVSNALGPSEGVAVQTNHKIYTFIEGSLEVKVPTIWTDGKAEMGRVREEKRREAKKREDQRRERPRRKKMQVSEKVEKSQVTVFLQ